MTVELLAAFALASCVLLIIPGPTILTVISYSVTHGARAKLPLVAAVALGDSTALLLSVAGLGVVLASTTWMFTLVKVLGGLYLIYLGLKQLLSSGSLLESETTTMPDSRWTLFRNTWLVTALNPKGIVFFIAFLPQFINPAQPAAHQLWILSATFVVLATANALLYAAFASKASELLSSAKAQRRFNIGGGTLLMVAGGWALTAKRSS